MSSATTTTITASGHSHFLGTVCMWGASCPALAKHDLSGYRAYLVGYIDNVGRAKCLTCAGDEPAGTPIHDHITGSIAPCDFCGTPIRSSSL